MLHRLPIASGPSTGILADTGQPHRVFGDRDAGHGQRRPGVPRGCGLFGRLGTDSKLPPANPPRGPVNFRPAGRV